MTVTTGLHASEAVAMTDTCAPSGPVHSAVSVAGQTSAGGTLSRTMIAVCPVSVAPFESVTRNTTLWDPIGNVTSRMGPEPSDDSFGCPGSRNQSNVTMSSFVPGVESGSVDAEASSATMLPAGLVHSTVDGDEITACGGLFGRTNTILG